MRPIDVVLIVGAYAAPFLLCACAGLATACNILRRQRNHLEAENRELRWQTGVTGRDARQAHARLGILGDHWIHANTNIPQQRRARRTPS